MSITRPGAFLVIAALFVAPLAARANGDFPSSSITAASLRGHVYFLASQSLGGRYPGSRGFRTAADYAASQLEAAGVRPIAGSAGEPGYLQAVPLLKRSLAKSPVVTVRTSAGERVFSEGSGLRIFSMENLPANGEPLPVVFAGFGIHEPSAGWDDFRDLDVSGKVVLFLMGAPEKDGKPLLPEALHGIYAPMNSIMRKALSVREAAAAIVLTDTSMASMYQTLPAVPEEPQLVPGDRERGAFRAAPFAIASADLGNAIFGASGIPSAEDLATGRATSRALEGVSIGISASPADEDVASWNVLGLVEGTDPALREQVVVVSAHIDALPPGSDGGAMPGANDNASGVAALLEMAGAIASHPARRSILLVVATAEEGGMSGIRTFLARGPIPAARIVADVNMDMIGRTEERCRDDRSHYVVDSDRVTPAFRKLIEEVDARTVGWPLRYEHPLNMGDSDHRAFEALGIPAANFYSGKVPETHRGADTPDTLDYEKLEKIARLVCEIALELGNRNQLWK